MHSRSGFDRIRAFMKKAPGKEDSTVERREFLVGLAATTAAVAASQLATERDAMAASNEMHAAKYSALAQSSGHCVATGDACLRHCFGMLAMSDARMVSCMKAAYDMIAVCGALQTLAATNSEHVAALAKVAIEVCADCRKQCDKYPKVAECKACAEACATNIEECQEVVG